jgi:hypothetical protein
MSWSLEFDEPITLAKGKTLRTLRDAGKHIAALPNKRFCLPHWQVAAQCLLSPAGSPQRRTCPR